MKASFRSAQAGFTLIEIGLVVSVMAILLTVSYVGYNGIVDKAVASSARNDLDSVKKNMEISFAKNGGKYPNFIPDDVKPSDGITLRLVESKPYTSLTPPQNAQLLVSTCDQLITEGYGSGVNIWGSPAHYITDCQIHGGGFQVTGWHTFPGTTSIGDMALTNWYTTHVTPQAGFPDKLDVHLAFAAELERRHSSLGGDFPATTTSGTAVLPTPNAGYVPTEYCVEASHVSHTDIIWHVDQSGKVLEGEC